MRVPPANQGESALPEGSVLAGSIDAEAYERWSRGCL